MTPYEKRMRAYLEEEESAKKSKKAQSAPDDEIEEPLTDKDAWSLRKLKAQTAKIEADTKAKELDLAIQRGEYLPKADIELWSQTVVTVFSSALQRVPKRMASSLVGLDATKIQDRLEKELDRVVTVLRKEMEKIGNE